MESLSRNNYEIWFLDYLDGQLSHEQLETLQEFIEQNPDLKAELDGLAGVSLPLLAESFISKDTLLKTEQDIPGIGALDQLCIARMEQDLPENEAREFDLRLKQDPALEKEYLAFLQTRLYPGNPVEYPHKNALRKNTFRMSPWLITVISSAAIFLLAWFFWPEPTKNDQPVMAKVEQPVQKPMEVAKNNPVSTTVSRQPESDSPRSANTNRTGRPGKAVRQSPETPEQPLREPVLMQPLFSKSAVAGPMIPDPMGTRYLLASSANPVTNVMVSPEVLTLPEYALKMFRIKILGEDRLVVKRTRFSLWEVAGAGVNKINSLAGTKMKLNREYDEQGDIQAISFNSRLFDVETPVRGQAAR